MQFKRIRLSLVLGLFVWAGGLYAQSTGSSSFTPASFNQPSPNFGLLGTSPLNISGALCASMASSLQPLINLTSSSGTAACTATDPKSCVYSEPQVPTCPNSSTTYPKKIFDQAVCSAQRSESCMTQKSQALDSMMKELSCIQTQESGVEDQIRRLQSAWQNNLQSMQQNVGQIDAVVKDRQTQMGFLNTKLTGSPKGDGSGGLLQIQGQFQGYYSQIQTDNLSLTQGFTALQNEQATMQQNIQSFEMGKAQACMNTASGQYHCQLNGPPCSLVQYIQAVYYALNRTQASNAQNQAQSQSTASGLSALLNTIFANMSNQTQLNIQTMSQSSAQQLITQQGAVTGIMSPSDILNQYGSQLAAYNIGPLNVQQVFLSGFESCYEAAQSAVGAEQNQPGTAVYNYFQQVSNDSSKFRASIDQFNSKYSDVYNSFWTTLGMTGPINATTCMANATSTTGKMTCVQDLTTNFEGLYTGTSPNSQVNIAVPGVSTNPPTTFTINCYGVNGCVTQFKNAVNNVGQEMTRLDSVKVGYITQANAAIQGFVTNTTALLSPQTQAIKQAFMGLTQQLTSYGVNLQLPPYVQGEQLTKSKTTDSQGNQIDGLYNMPQNILNVVGGGAAPPLYDLSGGGLTQGIQSIQDQQREDQQKASQADGMIAQIKAAAQTCQQSIQQTAVNSVVTKASALNQQCDQNAVWCSQGGSSQLQNLQSSLADISGSGLDTSSIDQALATGIGSCSVAMRASGGSGGPVISAAVSSGQINAAGGAQIWCQTNAPGLIAYPPQGSMTPTDYSAQQGIIDRQNQPKISACVAAASNAQGYQTGQQNISACAAQATNLNSAITALGGSSGNTNNGLGN